MKRLIDFGTIIKDIFKFFDNAYKQDYLHYLIGGIILLFLLIMISK